jgi:hypothetical protein
MKWIFNRQDDVERGFRAGRARPSSELMNRIEERVHVESRDRGTRKSFRLAVPVMLTAVCAIALASVGGVSYAATQVESAIGTASHALTLKSSKKVSIVAKATSGQDQYRSGYGWGSYGHNHTGSPGIGLPGSFKPPLFAANDGLAAFVVSTFTIDEQAHLWVSVIDDNGTELLITQKKSKIGEGIHGVQAKNINYLVLIPRTIPIRLAIPRNLLIPGHHYRIRIIARAPNHLKKTLYIGFTYPGV